MSRTWTHRLLILTLLAALTAPTAWAVPAWAEVGGWWGGVLEWVVGAWEKGDTSMNPCGEKTVPPPPPPDYLDDGPGMDADG